MAHIIRKMPEAGRGTARYPWNEWLDGKARILVRGEDFDITLQHMQTSVNNAARRRGMHATCRKVSDTELAMQAWKGDE